MSTFLLLLLLLVENHCCGTRFGDAQNMHRKEMWFSDVIILHYQRKTEHSLIWAIQTSDIYPKKNLIFITGKQLQNDHLCSAFFEFDAPAADNSSKIHEEWTMKSESSSGNHRENTELYNNCPSGSLPLTAGHLRQSDVNGRYTCTAVRKIRCINYRMNGKTNNKHIQLQQTSLWRWWQEYPQRITCQFVFEYWNSMEFRLMCIVQCNSLHVKNLSIRVLMYKLENE